MRSSVIKRMIFRVSIVATATLLLHPILLTAQKTSGLPVNRDAAIGAEFEERVADYMKIHEKAQAGLVAPKSTESPVQISEFQHRLAARIRVLRPNAKQGDIFTPAITGVFHRLVAIAMHGSDGARIRTSFERAEPIEGVHLDVNQAYPDGMPLQSMPPSLLLNLPKLPKELEYRFVGRELILRDIAANLIVDVIPEVTTAPRQKKK